VSEKESVSHASFCFGCGKQIETLRERLDRNCSLCRKQHKESFIVFDDTVRSIENMVSRASINNARQRREGE